MISATINEVQTSDGTVTLELPSAATQNAIRESVGMIPKGTPVPGGGHLALDLVVDLYYGGPEVIARTYWLDDYACGKTEEEAKANLLISLVQLRESIDRLKGKRKLSDELAETLNKLTQLITR